MMQKTLEWALHPSAPAAAVESIVLLTTDSTYDTLNVVPVGYFSHWGTDLLSYIKTMHHEFGTMASTAPHEVAVYIEALVVAESVLKLAVLANATLLERFAAADNPLQDARFLEVVDCAEQLRLVWQHNVILEDTLNATARA
jgi:hypothetical protein